MMIDALSGILLIPALSAALLAALPGYRLTSRINVVATLLTFSTARSPRGGATNVVWTGAERPVLLSV